MTQLLEASAQITKKKVTISLSSLDCLQKIKLFSCPFVPLPSSMVLSFSIFLPLLFSPFSLFSLVSSPLLSILLSIVTM